jgi:hypothetical protein
MSTALKLRRGTTAQHSTFTGAEAEVTVDTTKDTVVVHDGSTAGGFPLARESSVVAKAGDTMTGPLNVPMVVTDTSLSFRNRIINGDMRIDQRNAGASVTPTVSGTYTIDRWIAGLAQASKFSVQQNAGSVTPPVGFTDYLGVTSTSAYTVGSTEGFVVTQIIEGNNIADLAWGTANAQTVTLSFWVRSSLTGTFGGALRNNGSTRSYPYSYTISSANTWEYKTITVSGDTAGTWLSNNGIGLSVIFSLGAGSSASNTAGDWAAGNFISATGATSVVGTNGATFYITGVQLEAGSVATPFERRPFGTELALCQRYYWRTTAAAAGPNLGLGYGAASSIVVAVFPCPVPMRAAPTALDQTGSASDYSVRTGTTNFVCASVPTLASTGELYAGFFMNGLTGITNGSCYGVRPVTTGAYFGFSAEL